MWKNNRITLRTKIRLVLHISVPIGVLVRCIAGVECEIRTNQSVISTGQGSGNSSAMLSEEI